MDASDGASSAEDTTGMGGGAASASSGGTTAGLGYVGMGAMAGGDILSGLGALYSGEMESAALNAQANLQMQNAGLDLEAGNANAAKSQIVSGQRIGAIQGSAAASGVTQSGSVLSVLAASSMNAEMDRQNIIHGAQVKAVQAENQASMDKIGAQSSQTGSYMQAFSKFAEAGFMIAAL